MRAAVLALLASTVLAPTGSMAEPQAPLPVGEVHVSIGPKLQAKAKELGQRDLTQLAQDLKDDVEKALARKHRLAAGGARLDLVITDAVPNRPTFAQMAQRPGLSMRSISVGGASIEGTEVRPDGTSRFVRYSNWETDLSQERGAITWTDADQAFMSFARDYADGRR